MIPIYIWLTLGFLAVVMIMFIVMSLSLGKNQQEFREMQKRIAERLEGLEGKVLRHRKVIKRLYKPERKEAQP